MAEALKTAEVEAAQRNKELAAAQKEMDAQRQLGQKQKETEAAQREAMRSAAAVKNDGAPSEDGASSDGASDAERELAVEKKPVGSLLPEKKCTDDGGEPIWCGGASSVGSPVGEVGASSTPISDAHKKYTDSE